MSNPVEMTFWTKDIIEAQKLKRRLEKIDTIEVSCDIDNETGRGFLITVTLPMMEMSADDVVELLKGF